MSAQPHKVHLPHPAPANDPPQMRTMEAIAEEFGFKNTRAARDWCKRRGVPYRRDGKFNWVDRLRVAAAIDGRPAVVPAPADPSVSTWVRSTVGGTHGA